LGIFGGSSFAHFSSLYITVIEEMGCPSYGICLVVWDVHKSSSQRRVLMNERLKTGNGNQDVERDGVGMSRRKFIKVASIGVLTGPFLIEAARADDITPATLKSMGKQFADVDLSDEEVAGASPLLDAITKGIRGVDVGEEVEPATVFYRRKEK
jgi:hypothetical protein